jgi:hypothetical protein
MHTRLACLTFGTVLATAGRAVANDKITSKYSALAGKACTTHIDDAATGASTTECPGIQKFRLLVLEDDKRSSVSIVTPERRVFPLNYWDVVTRGFSSLAGKAEWRVANVGGKAVPIALIVRVNTVDQSDPEHPKQVPVLAVARITPDTACVTHRLDALPRNAPEQARKAADAANAECLANPSETNRSQKG